VSKQDRLRRLEKDLGQDVRTVSSVRQPHCVRLHLRRTLPLEIRVCGETRVLPQCSCPWLLNAGQSEAGIFDLLSPELLVHVSGSPLDDHQ
jgi:hypothetical protein